MRIFLHDYRDYRLMITTRYPISAGNYMFKVNYKNTRTRWKICSKLTIKTPEQRHWYRFGVFIVNIKQISHLVLVYLMLILRRKMPPGLLQTSRSDVEMIFDVGTLFCFSVLTRLFLAGWFIFYDWKYYVERWVYNQVLRPS